jgi:hypothetical protein
VTDDYRASALSLHQVTPRFKSEPAGVECVGLEEAANCGEAVTGLTRRAPFLSSAS